MLISRPVKKGLGYIVITSDRGLVGGYNSSILKAVMELQKEYHPSGDDFEVICISGIEPTSLKLVAYKANYSEYESIKSGLQWKCINMNMFCIQP